MAYIGTDINYGNIASQTGVGNGSTTPIATLDYTVPTSSSIIVTLDGVTQVPTTDYTASGTTLTFTSSVASPIAILVVFLGRSLDIGTPADNTVTNAKMANNAIDSAELVAGSVDDAHLATGITASKLSGIVPTANLGTGTASSTTVLYGDGTYKTEPVTANEITKQSGAPTVSSPSTPTVGDLILATSTQQLYVCQTVSVGANVWANIGDGTGGIAPIISATGGTISTYSYGGSDYKLHTFTSSGANNLVIASAPAGKTIDILVIAGGGGAGGARHGACSGGGGGAGGLRWFTAQSPSAATYVATIGAGGAGGSGTYGAAGTNSSFIGTGISITGTGGGGGERNHAAHASQHGGSGGGASANDAGGYGHTGLGNQGSYTPVEGYNGGGPISPVQNGNGGGGSGGIPTVLASTGRGGDGGAGEDNFLNQSSSAFTVAATKALLDSAGVGEVSGSSRHIAAGGGGGYYTSTNIGYGGLGFAGNGGDGSLAPTAATVNTGSGGGGGGGSLSAGSTQAGANGASGVVIIRYLA